MDPREQWKRETVYCVEASSFEQHALWVMHSKDSSTPAYKSTVSWEQLNPGSMVRIQDDPVICVSLFWVRLEGRVAVFYDATSQVVDWRKVEDWIKEQFPGIPTCDAMNFGSCVHKIRELNNAPR